MHLLTLHSQTSKNLKHTSLNLLLKYSFIFIIIRKAMKLLQGYNFKPSRKILNLSTRFSKGGSKIVMS